MKHRPILIFWLASFLLYPNISHITGKSFYGLRKSNENSFTFHRHVEKLGKNPFVFIVFQFDRPLFLLQHTTVRVEERTEE